MQSGPSTAAPERDESLYTTSGARMTAEDRHLLSTVRGSDETMFASHGNGRSVSSLRSAVGTRLADWGNLSSFHVLLSSLPAALLTIASTLRPSFTRRLVKKPRRLHSTSYLDGLRGVAAVVVVFGHYVSQFATYLSFGWGSPGDNDRFLQLPVVRALHCGRWMVTIFFVISGYVLSYKAVGLAREREHSALLKSLSSSVFRRWLRLMTPAIVSTLMVLCLVRAGVSVSLLEGWENGVTEASSALLADSTTPPVIVGGTLPPRLNSTVAQVAEWFEDTRKLSDPFRFGYIEFPRYNGPLWTMGVEYTGSMVVFLVLLGTALVRQHFRIIVPAGIALYALIYNKWSWTLFLVGILFAERAYILNDSRKATLPVVEGAQDDAEKIIDTPQSDQRFSQKLPKLIALVFLLHLGSFPDFNSENTPGYRTLAKIIPPAYSDNPAIFYSVIAAIFLIYLLETSKFLQDIFTTPFSQYLGDISLSLYMVHVQVELTLGNWLFPRCLNLTSGLTHGHFELGMAMAFCILFSVTVCASDVFWRVVDVRCVNFSRWFAVQCFQDDGEDVQ